MGEVGAEIGQVLVGRQCVEARGKVLNVRQDLRWSGGR